MPWERVKTRHGTRLRRVDPAAAKAAKAAPAPEPDEAADSEDVPPALSDLTKAELLAQAEQQGVSVSAHATKAEIIEALDGAHDG